MENSNHDKNVMGITVNRRRMSSVLITLMLYFIPTLLDPLAAYGPNASKALGFLLASVFFMIGGQVSISIVAMLVACTGVMTGLFSWSNVAAKLGSSSFYQALGMMIVAMGCEFTAFGQRFAYHMLKALGKKPTAMIISIAVVSALLSSVVSNMAIIIIMSSIANNLLIAMGERPGESAIGKAAMLCVVMGAMAGGMGLICGSPIGNTAALTYMTSSLGGADYSPSFKQWGLIAFPTLLVCIVPMAMVYIQYFGVKDSAFHGFSPSYYDEKIRALGNMSGAEWRWIIILISMIAAMNLGMKTAHAAVFFAAISLFPVVGVSNSKEVFRRIPWDPLIAICMLPLMSEVIVNSGLGTWLCAVLEPLLGNVSPLVFSLLCSVAMALLINLLVNSMQATMALVMSVAAPICVSLGYNPTVILLPSAMASSYMWMLGANQYVMLNAEYGWWKMRETIVPGLLTTLIPAVVAPVAACLIGPLIGIPLYL